MSHQAETFANAWKSTLSGNGGSITSGATAFNVAAAAGPAPRAVAADSPPTFFRAVIDGDTPSSNTEIIWVTAMSGAAVSTCVRAAETYPGGCIAGAPVAHNDGVPIRAVLTANSYERIGRTPSGFGPAAYQLLAWSHDPFMFGYGGDTLAFGAPYFEAVAVGGESLSITNLIVMRSGAGSGLSNCFLGLYDSAGNRLGITADLSSAWAAAVGATYDERYPIVGGPISYVPKSAEDWLHVGLLLGAGTSPSFSCDDGGSSGGSQKGSTLSTGPRRSGSTGLTGQTALPSTITPANIDAQGFCFWVALD